MKQKTAVFTMLCLLAVGAPQTCASAESGTASLAVRISGFQNESGSAAIVLWKSPGNGFPVKVGEAVRTARSPIRGKTVLCVFDNLMPGIFAVSIYHDENGNGKMDRNLFGMPTEARGASRNPRPVMRPPRFTEASFDLRGGDNRIEISVID